MRTHPQKIKLFFFSPQRVEIALNFYHLGPHWRFTSSSTYFNKKFHPKQTLAPFSGLGYMPHVDKEAEAQGTTHAHSCSSGCIHMGLKKNQHGSLFSSSLDRSS